MKDDKNDNYSSFIIKIGNYYHYVSHDYKRAKKLYKKVLKEKMAKEIDVELKESVLHQIGLVYAKNGEREKALKYLNESLEMAKKKCHSIPITLNDIGLVYAGKGDYEEALEYYEKSLIMKRTIYDQNDHPSIANTLNNIGSVYYKTREYDKALEYYKKSLEMHKEEYMVKMITHQLKRL